MSVPVQVWSVEAVIDQFHQVKSDQTAKILGRRNPGVNTWGVKFGDIDKLARKIKRDSEVGIALWQTGILEARFLACQIIDPTTLTEA